MEGTGEEGKSLASLAYTSGAGATTIVALQSVA